jgi:mono/diheme cytochrome c family protein
MPIVKSWKVRLALLCLALLGACVGAWSRQVRLSAKDVKPALAPAAMAASVAAANPPDSAKAEAAFLRAWSVFVSPRCMNCHPSGDAPLQGDDSHVHIQDVKRGPTGQGLYGMKCHTCHQDSNLPGENMPPGNPKWSLPPVHMKMVIQGETPGQVCRQLKNPALNGGRTMAQILEHVSKDELVGWGWDPGDGRTLPPLSRQDFVAAMREWADNGASCPK